jgi:hypothetical protein
MHVFDSEPDQQVETVVSRAALPQRIWTVCLCSPWPLAGPWLKATIRHDSNENPERTLRLASASG